MVIRILINNLQTFLYSSLGGLYGWMGLVWEAIVRDALAVDRARDPRQMEVSRDGYFIGISCQMSSGFSNLPWSPSSSSSSPAMSFSILGLMRSGQIQIIFDRSSYLLSSVTCLCLCFCAYHSMHLDQSVPIRRKSLSEQPLTISDISPPAAKPPVDWGGADLATNARGGVVGWNNVVSPSVSTN